MSIVVAYLFGITIPRLTWERIENRLFTIWIQSNGPAPCPCSLAKVTWRIYDEDDALALFVVMFPKVTVATLTGHIESRETNISVWKLEN